MKGFSVLVLISLLFISYGETSFMRMAVKEGDEVPIVFNNATEIQRTVEAGEQIFYFTGKHQGKFVDLAGKEVDSSNFEIQNGSLVIKKFSNADVGLYHRNPNQIYQKKADGSITSVLGPSLLIIIE